MPALTGIVAPYAELLTVISGSNCVRKAAVAFARAAESTLFAAALPWASVKPDTTNRVKPCIVPFGDFDPGAIATQMGDPKKGRIQSLFT